MEWWGKAKRTALSRQRPGRTSLSLWATLEGRGRLTAPRRTAPLASYKNVLILTTSNITGAIDLAFVDRYGLRSRAVSW